MAVGYASFTSLYNYSPQQNDEIELRVGDVILIKKPVDSNALQEWLQGINQRTKRCGMIPGTYLKEMAEFPETLQTNGHDFLKLIKINPACCEECGDYIWGKNSKLYFCTLCENHFHLLCAKSTEPCQASERQDYNESLYDHLAKSPSEWNVEEVVCWLAATNIFQYGNIFKQHQMSGEKLVNCDQSRLAHMGIHDDFHQKMILACIGELIGNSETRHAKKYPGMKTGDKGSKDTHDLVLRNFTTITWCHECGYILFGLVRQGLQCTKCDLIVHRKCTNYQRLRICPGKPLIQNTPTPLFTAPSIGYEIPILVKKCVGAVESRGLRTRGIYKRQLGNSASKYALREALYNDAEYVDMKDEEWINPLCPSAVLYSFFDELQDSLIPSHLYNEVMSATVKPVGESLLEMDKLFEKLDEGHCAVLEFLFQHLNRVVASENEMSEKDIADIFGVVLLRPGQQHLTLMCKNLEKHSKVLQLLLARSRKNLAVQNQLDDDKVEPSLSPPVPPRLPKRLDNSEWYWGKLSSPHVQKMMESCRDGSFLVRDSNKSPGDYVLVVKINNESKLIKIFQKNGKYGFDETKFNSVQEIIQFYRSNSLKKHNPELDIMLLYPVCWESVDTNNETTTVPFEGDVSNVEKATKILKIAGEQFNEKSLLYEKLSDDIIECSETMSALEDAIFAQKELISFLAEQQKIHQNVQREVSLRDQELLEFNYSIVANRLAEENGNLSCLENELQLKSDSRRSLESEMNLIKPDLWELVHTKEKYMRFLEDNNFMTREEVELLSGDTDFKIYELPVTDEEETQNLSPSNWLFGTLDRDTASQYLEKEPDGTFLIRDSSRVSTGKAISVVFDGAVRHCMIDEGPEGFGFAEGFKTHKTLVSLVEYYHRVSLQMHNKGLSTTLRYPVRCRKPTIQPYVK